MSYNKVWAFLAAPLLVGIVLLPNVQAGIVSYTDQASWEAALAGAATLEDFESATADDDFSGGSTTSPNGDLGLAAVTIGSSNAQVDLLPFISASDINGDAHLSMRYLDNGNGTNPAESITVTLPAGLSAFAFEYLNYDSGGDGTSLSFTGTNGQNVDATVGGAGAFDSTAGGIGSSGVPFFFGVIDDGASASITSFSFTGDPSVGTGASAFNSFDDVRYGEAIPEPATAMLAATLALGLCGFRRRR